MDSKLVCRVCLVTGVKMYDMEKYKLNHLYQDITGDWLNDHNLQSACFECSSLLKKYHRFKEKCLKSQAALIDSMSLNFGNIKSAINTIDRQKLKLLSNLTVAIQTDVLEINESDDVKREICEFDDKQDVDLKVEDILDCEMSEDYDDLPLIDIKKEEIKKVKETTPTKKKRTRTKKEKAKIKVKWLPGKDNKEDVVSNKMQAWRSRLAFNEDFATVIHLTHDEQIAELAKRKESSNYQNSPYKCELCFKGFAQKQTYQNHRTLHEPISGSFICGICSVRAKSARLLRWHMNCSHALRFKCTKCPHVCHTAAQARYHDKWHNGFTYQCQYCGKTFSKPTTYFTHVRISHPTEFVCELCGESFINQNGLVMHKTRSHKTKQKVHSLDDKSGEMSDCKYCEECEINFTSLIAWRRHMATSLKHQDNEMYRNSCHMCGKSCDSLAQLTAHIVTHQRRLRNKELKENKNEIGVKKIRKSETKKIKCNECDAVFANTPRVQAHYKRIHLGIKYEQKKQVCEVCGKYFKSQATLAIHQRTHTDERPFPCTTCSKAFRDKSALWRHMRSHTGIKPYQCVHCGKSFSQSNSMKIHIHTVHLKLPTPYKSKSRMKGQSYVKSYISVNIQPQVV